MSQPNFFRTLFAAALRRRKVSRAFLLPLYMSSQFTFAPAAMAANSWQNQQGQQEPPSPSAAQEQAQRPRRVFPPAANDKAMIPDSDEIIRIDTDLALVGVSVTDAAGRFVRGLKPEDFKLYEDGAQRPVTFFNAERRIDLDRPLAVVFALDVSGSMTPDELIRLSGAMRAFVARLSQTPSRFAVISFGMDVRIIQRFTDEPGKLDEAFERLLSDPNGLSTHAYDAVDDAIRLLIRKAPRVIKGRQVKRAVVIISDGFPVGDTVSPQTVIERANAAEVSVYTVTFPSYSSLRLGSAQRAPLPTPLDVSGLAERTGGRNVFASEQEYEPLFRALAEEVTSSYVLAFYPSEEKRRDGRFHTVRVEAPPGLTVRQHQTGYTGTARR